MALHEKIKNRNKIYRTFTSLENKLAQNDSVCFTENINPKISIKYIIKTDSKGGRKIRE